MKKMVAWGSLNKTFLKTTWLCSGCNPLERIFHVCIFIKKILFMFVYEPNVNSHSEVDSHSGSHFKGANQFSL